jgi:predicted DNA-binding transcriptional regulator YafY
MACKSQRVASFKYAREDGERSDRCVWPLALVFWSGVWTLTSWCELRSDFRDFRLDRMEEVAILERTFSPKKGQRLEDHLRKVAPSAEERRELLSPGALLEWHSCRQSSPSALEEGNPGNRTRNRQ